MERGGDSGRGVVEDRRVLGVTELNERLSDLVDGAGDLQDAAYTGEIVDVHETSTALYFDLTDGDCSIPCVLWQWRYEQLDVEVEEGAEVLVDGELDFWPEGGKLSIHPHEVSVLGDGERASRLEALQEDLRERGLFADDHKQALPRFPTTVGVATSRDGDARYDVESSITDQYPGVDIVLRHTTVQGADAPERIADAVGTLDDHDAVDVIVVGRGGGSGNDMMAFNTEIVAEAIFETDTPTIAAVGHTEDTTFAGLAADHRAITPSAAGSRAVPNREEYRQRVERHRSELSTAYADHVRDELSRLETGLEASYDRRVERELSALETDLETAAEDRFSREVRRLDDELDSTYERLEYDRELESEVRAARTQAVRRYRIAVAILVVLFIGTALLWWIT